MVIERGERIYVPIPSLYSLTLLPLPPPKQNRRAMLSAAATRRPADLGLHSENGRSTSSTSTVHSEKTLDYASAEDDGSDRSSTSTLVDDTSCTERGPSFFRTLLARIVARSKVSAKATAGLTASPSSSSSFCSPGTLGSFVALDSFTLEDGELLDTAPRDTRRFGRVWAVSPFAGGPELKKWSAPPF
jgi:hypothetical protein